MISHQTQKEISNISEKNSSPNEQGKNKNKELRLQALSSLEG